LVAIAQKPRAVIKKANVDPVIDGIVEPVWADAEAENNIDQPSLRNGEITAPTLDESGETIILPSFRQQV